MLDIRTILFGTDFSPHSRYAFALASALARDYKAKLIIAHVREAPITPVGEFGFIPPEGEDSDEAKRYLFSLSPGAGIDVQYLLGDGAPGRELIRMADDNNCDLVVVGSHGHTGLARLLMGSVAEQLVRLANCPVLVVKNPAQRRTLEESSQEESATV